MSPNPKKFRDITYSPTIIPLNEHTTPTYALGLGMTINF